MPYKEHPSFQPPTHENAIIWRYMDLAKFIAMLDHRALFFSQAARLADPFEGSYPEATVRVRAEVNRIITEYFGRLPSEEIAVNWLQETSERNMGMRRLMYVNCWHLNEQESAAMWELYGQRGSSIAIRSTFARLRDSMASAWQLIRIGTVRYIDYATAHVAEDNAFNPFLCKRQSYAHEQELRALYFHPASPEELPYLPPGWDIACDLDRLIDTILVSPGAPSWFKDVVTSITKRYAIEKEPVQSSLDSGPVF